METLSEGWASYVDYNIMAKGGFGLPLAVHAVGSVRARTENLVVPNKFRNVLELSNYRNCDEWVSYSDKKRDWQVELVFSRPVFMEEGITLFESMPLREEKTNKITSIIDAYYRILESITFTKRSSPSNVLAAIILYQYYDVLSKDPNMTFLRVLAGICSHPKVNKDELVDDKHTIQDFIDEIEPFEALTSAEKCLQLIIGETISENN